MKNKKPMPGHYGENIVRHAQKKFIQGRQREKMPPLAGKVTEKLMEAAANKGQPEK